MSNHFDYLVKDDASNFFQKLAVDEASVRASDVAPEAMKKIASAQSPFEKVAARIERDLELIKLAGECGVNAGMMRRANAYIDVVVAHGGLNNDELEQVFDKVAAESIQVDLLAAYDQLCADVPDGYEGLVDDVLVKAGHDLTELALLEKQARFGLGALGRAGGATRKIEQATSAVQRGAHGAAGVAGQLAGGGSGAAKVRAGLAGAGAVAKDVAKQTAGKVTAPFKSVADKYRTARTARMARTRGELASSLQTARAASSKPGIQGTAARAQAASIEKSIAGNKSSALEQASRAADKTKEKMGLGKKPSSADTTTPAAAAAPKADGSGAKSPPKTKETAADDGPERPKTMDEGGPIPPPPGGSSGKPAGFMDAWKKATTSGWKSLSAEERGSLIRGGVTAALVYRAATGKGAITGDEGVI